MTLGRIARGVCATLCSLLLCVLATSIIPLDSAAQEYGFTILTDKQFQERQIEPQTHQFAISADNIYVVWSAETNYEGSILNSEIFMAVSTDNGQSFKNVNISNTPARSSYPRVAASDGSVYVVWLEVFDSRSSLYYSMSDDSGKTFSKPKEIMRSSGEPMLITTSDCICVFSINRVGDTFSVQLIRSSDGAQFEEPENALNHPYSHAYPIVSKNENAINVWYFVWGNLENSYHSESVLRRSTDGGKTFKTIILTENTHPYALIESEGNLYLLGFTFPRDTLDPAYTDEKGITFLVSRDRGATFESVMNPGGISKEYAGSSAGMAVSDDHIYLIVNEVVSGSTRKVLLTSTDGGSTFDFIGETRIVGLDGEMISIDGKLYFVRQTGSGVSVMSSADGSSFTTLGVFGTGSEVYKFPRMLADEASLYVVWGGQVGFSKVNRIVQQNSIEDLSTEIEQPSTESLPEKPVEKETLSPNPLVISVGDRPEGVAVNTETNMVYVANYYSSSVSVIDGKKNLLVATIPITWSVVPTSVAEPYTDMPEYVAVNSKTNTVYVNSPLETAITIIDGASNMISGKLDIDGVPAEIAVDSEDGLVYAHVSSSEGSFIHIIDENTHGTVGTIRLDDSIRSIEVNSETDKLYVATSDVLSYLFEDAPAQGKLLVLDSKTGQSLETLDLTVLPQDIVVNPYTEKVYVSGTREHNDEEVGVTVVIDGRSNTVLSEIVVGIFPSSMAVSTENNLVFVVDYETNQTHIINGSDDTFILSVPFGGYLSGIAVNDDSDRLYVTNHVDSGTVSVFDTAVIPEFPTGVIFGVVAGLIALILTSQRTKVLR